MKNLSFFCLVLLAPFICFQSCSPTGKLTFEIQNKSASPSFSSSKGYQITATKVQLVLGDFALSGETPDDEIKLLPSLPPLLPNSEVVDAADIGKGGKFPGVWVVDLTPGKSGFRFPTGVVEAGSYQQLTFRNSPGVSGIRGISSSDDIYQHTLLYAGTVLKGTTSCPFQVRTSFELGLQLKFAFSTKGGGGDILRLVVDTQKWIDHVDFSKICKDATTKEDVSDSSFPSITEQVKQAYSQSIAPMFVSGDEH